ncbi:MAG TPA: DNA polymerase I [Candidatus Polarisedimenticolia bacterium]|nr:DNA polymerase I [Candidatus Polarisedimenticolia bacterium]
MKNAKDETVYLVDGTYNIFRAYHATPRMTTSKGLPTNALYVFCMMLRKLIVDEKPSLLGVAFDTEAPTFRHVEFEEYKAHRPPPPEDLVPQFPFARRVCEALGVFVIEKDGYEADDVIATLAERAKTTGHPVVIVTSDKDMFQLVDDQVKILNPAKGNLLMDAGKVAEIFGVPPGQVRDVLALWGDASDNVPGVPGIGEKGAKDLIRTFGSLDEAYKHAAEIPRKAYREGLTSHYDMALKCRDLVTIRRDVPLDLELGQLRYAPTDTTAAYALFSELEFSSLQQEFAPRAVSAPSKYAVVLTEEDLDAALSRARQDGILSVDLETTGVDPMRAAIVGVALCSRPHDAVYVPVGHIYLGAPTQLPMETVLAKLRPALEDPALPKVGQNVKYELVLFRRHGIGLNPVAFDSMIASYLIDPGRRQHNLDVLALDHLDHRTILYKEIAGTGKSEVTLDMVEVEKVAEYAGEDAEVALRLKGVLEPKLTELELDELYQDLELPLIAVLARMEMAGVKVDSGVLKQMSSEFAVGMAKLESEIYELAGGRFNINSPAQLGDILFEKLQLASRRRTAKTRALSTSVDVLEELATQHPLPRKILDYRSLSKLKSTYIDALPALINPETGRVHTSYNQTVAATGRLSSSDPNLQNIPARTAQGRKIRAAFVPEPGHLFLAADYSQVELRVMAHMADVPELVDAFRSGEDIHRRTAAEIFGVMPDLVTSEMRTQAKTINFGVLYGMGAVSLALQLGITRKAAQEFIERYFNRFPRIREYIDETTAAAERDGFVTTLFNRRRYFPELKGPDRMARQQALRAAVNTTIQGTAADLIKKAMLKLDAALAERRCGSRMILQVHDELVLECPKEEVEAVTPVVTGCMEGAANLRAPLTVDVKVGDSWEAVT